MRICVIGAGSMGGMYGGRLAEAGHDVLLVDTWVEHVRAINDAGLRLDGVGGDRRIPVKAATPAEAQGTFEAAIIFVDANSTAAAAGTAKRLVGAEGFAISLQNGIGNVEALVAALGEARVVGGLSYHSAELKGPGHVSHTHRGNTWIGELDGRRSERLARLEAALNSADLVAECVDDITAVIWTKFVLNCAINPLCAITGLRQGDIPRTPELDLYQDRIIDEALAVVAAKGLKLADPDIRAAIKKQSFLKYNKPSMLQHIEKGRRTEIDALNGALAREGRALGVPTPFNEAIALLIKGLEKRRLQEAAGTAIDYAALEAEAKREYEAHGLPARR
ncbi:MAG: 2-dehydropantoate 2-reductase [Rhodospirillaceae bacterium]|nr:2-dehydropantoate 2-reductase [Rhodospirillaceae bacterium]